MTYQGFWGMICENESTSSTCSTRIDKVTEALRELQKTLPGLFPIPPKPYKHGWRDSLSVFTSCASSEEIKRSVEAIRKQVDYPFILNHFHKCNSFSNDTVMQYMHTPDQELYKITNEKNSAGSCWKLVGELLPTDLMAISRIHLHDEEDDSKTATDEPWKLVKSKAKKQTDTFATILPSQVTDRNHIHLPVNEDDFEKARGIKGGKWMVHCSDEKTLDNYWKNLTCLYEKGVLVALKSCTAKSSIAESVPEYDTKAIMCYTADADCLSSIKRAAECIFSCTGYESLLYYKSNEASQSGRYRHEKRYIVTKYMFTVKGNMFEKDYLGRWKKVVLNQEKDKRVCSTSN